MIIRDYSRAGLFANNPTFRSTHLPQAKAHQKLRTRPTRTEEAGLRFSRQPFELRHWPIGWTSTTSPPGHDLLPFPAELQYILARHPNDDHRGSIQLDDQRLHAVAGETRITDSARASDREWRLQGWRFANRTQGAGPHLRELRTAVFHSAAATSDMSGKNPTALRGGSDASRRI